LHHFDEEQDPDPDPHQYEKSDLDLYQSEKWAPDPHHIVSDPQQFLSGITKYGK
jgi:hypothetical protein